MTAGITSLLVTLSISLLVTRVAAMALMFTGLSREAARFQARSAFSGVGFTTRESENLVNHPVRRRIVMILMLLGNIGIATVIASVIISVNSTVQAGAQDRFWTLVYLAVGFIVLFLFFSSRWVERQMNKIIAWALIRFTDLEIRDYQSLLQLADGYAVTEFAVEQKHWIAGGTLKDMRLADEGILILGIHRGRDTYQGVPRANDRIQAGDTLIIYGNLKNVRRLQERQSGQQGDRDHRKSAAEQAEKEAVERAAQEDPGAAEK